MVLVGGLTASLVFAQDPPPNVAELPAMDDGLEVTPPSNEEQVDRVPNVVKRNEEPAPINRPEKVSPLSELKSYRILIRRVKTPADLAKIEEHLRSQLPQPYTLYESKVEPGEITLTLKTQLSSPSIRQLLQGVSLRPGYLKLVRSETGNESPIEFSVEIVR